MKSFVSFLMAVCLIPSTSLATPGDVSNKVGLPFHHPTGVAWDGQHLWVADRKTDMFYEFDLAKQAIVDSIASPGYFPSGLAWDGKLLWSTDPSDAKIYATDVATGKTVATIDAPAAGPTGIAWEGESLWISITAIREFQRSIRRTVRPSSPSRRPRPIPGASYSVAGISGVPTV